MKRIFFSLAVVLGSALVALAILALRPNQKVHAQSSCTTALLSGNYGGYGFGFCPGSVKCNNVLFYHFDGSGNYEETLDDYMSNGTSGSASGFGTYSTATLTDGECKVTLSPSGGGSFPAAPVSSGSELYILVTTSGYNFSTILKKQ
jgi:hypothetical protein